MVAVSMMVAWVTEDDGDGNSGAMTMTSICWG